MGFGLVHGSGLERGRGEEDLPQELKQDPNTPFLAMLALDWPLGFCTIKFTGADPRTPKGMAETLLRIGWKISPYSEERVMTYCISWSSIIYFT